MQVHEAVCSLGKRGCCRQGGPGAGRPGLQAHSQLRPAPFPAGPGVGFSLHGGENRAGRRKAATASPTSFQGARLVPPSTAPGVRSQAATLPSPNSTFPGKRPYQQWSGGWDVGWVGKRAQRGPP